jgi:hypothetical protein
LIRGVTDIRWELVPGVGHSKRVEEAELAKMDQVLARVGHPQLHILDVRIAIVAGHPGVDSHDME